MAIEYKKTFLLTAVSTLTIVGIVAALRFGERRFEQGQPGQRPITSSTPLDR